jgi:hypothetical protein
MKFFRAGKPNLFIERAFPHALPFFWASRISTARAEFLPCEPPLLSHKKNEATLKGSFAKRFKYNCNGQAAFRTLPKKPILIAD